jgi:hypothetical protein
MDLVFELLKLSSVGLIAGLFSSIIANKDYRQRKWWELRVSAYQNAIEALSDLVYYYDSHYSATIEYREFSDEYKDKLDSFWEEAYPKIRKFADSGAFLFSDKANSAFREFMQKDNSESYVEHLDTKLDRAKKCLLKLVECSKTDLKLKISWYEKVF